MNPHEGPFDVQAWPAAVTARVVTPGPRPHLHGYDCEDELATATTMSERILLASTGELPGREQARALDVVWAFVEPVGVDQAPTHAALVARLCSGSTSSILATAAIVLAEQARSVVEELAPHWDWLARPAGDAPPALLAKDEEDRASVDRLRAALRATGLGIPALERDLARTPALVASLVACGLVEPHQVQAVWVQARLPVAFAEAMSDRPGNLREYPWDVPAFRYEEGSSR
jgi:hypothetical protein